ncbi:MAG: hypothetical protein J6563_07515 [Gilliamella sp.]|uniref:biotin/lipoyl-containing protein n=1 Tax=Gilliamella sp. TaxID=1891236 RepID=UPI00261CBE27|nr:biotin/lipoyl-containing protein [Gilliamella sp.]MCO6552802.1 hypothetical protein [Gilliamella sp.]
MIEHPDFCDDFNVHTRWIETELNTTITPAKRQIPAKEEVLIKTVIEIDGKHCKLGLSANLFAGFAMQTEANITSSTSTSANDALSDSVVPSPVSGNLFKWLIDDKQNVNEGDAIGIMEAMKMEVQIIAHRSGTVTKTVQEGDYVNAGDAVAEIN